MQFSQIEIIKIMLEGLIVVLGWVLVRRLEQIKSEVVRHSDFSRKWADLFFDASNAFMNSVERIMTNAKLITIAKNPNDENGLARHKELNSSLELLLENRYRIQRLAGLAPQKGPDAEKAAKDLYDSVFQFFNTKKAEIAELRGKIDAFNRAVREAHEEMIASRKKRKNLFVVFSNFFTLRRRD